MPPMLSLIREDVANVLEHDPAAKSRVEVYLCYAGLHAVWFYRLNHWLWRLNFFLLARRLAGVYLSIMAWEWSLGKPQLWVMTSRSIKASRSVELAKSTANATRRFSLT